MEEEKCIECSHSRRSHSKDKCLEWIDPCTGKECPCKVKYTDKEKFQ